MANDFHQADGTELSADDTPMAVLWREYCSADALRATAEQGIKAAQGRAWDDPRGSLPSLPRLEETHQRLLAACDVAATPEIARAIAAAYAAGLTAGHHARDGEVSQIGRSLLMARAAPQREMRIHNRCNNADAHDKRAKRWAPWQAQYRELRAAGMSATAARQVIGGRISEAGHRTPDDKTLRKWLPG